MTEPLPKSTHLAAILCLSLAALTARGFNLLFMAGRSLHGNSPGQVEFIGYLGIQVLLSNYGRTLSSEP